MGRPSKYNTHVEPRLTEVADWVRNGAGDREVAERLGIAESTLNEYKKQFPEFSECLKNTRARVDGQVESALLQRALAGDTTAMIFWLKNRRPEKWGELRKEDADEAFEIKVEIEDVGVKENEN